MSNASPPSPAPDRTDPTASATARVTALWSFTGKYRILHLTWIAFFLSFVVWFNYAPFANTIADQLGLTEAEEKTIALCNVALTIPARIFIGMALDRWGPRRVYAAILMFAVIPNTIFALSSSLTTLVVSRLALSVVGAGFVVGIRMVSEWFPPKEVGTVEGVYGGWGNFGAAAAAFSLPMFAGLFGGDDGWRWAILLTGVIAAGYGLFYLTAVTDTPQGVSYVRPRRQGALEVTNRRAVFGLAALTVPLNAALALIAWRVWRVDVINTPVFIGALVCVAGLLVVQEVAIVRVNRPALANAYPESDQYPFRSVAVLSLAYFATFGSELAVVSMLPSFFADTWGLGPDRGRLCGVGVRLRQPDRPADRRHAVRSPRLAPQDVDLGDGRRARRVRAALHHGCGVAVGAGGGGLHGVFLLRAVGCRGGVRHRAARQEAGQRADRRNGGCLRQHRRRRLPDDRIVRQRPGVLPQHRGSGGRGPRGLLLPGRASGEFRRRAAHRRQRRRCPHRSRESNAPVGAAMPHGPAIVPAAVGGS